MFSLEKFYEVMNDNLFNPLSIDYMYFKTFGSTDPSDLHYHSHDTRTRNEYNNIAIIYDQEPLYTNIVGNLWNSTLYPDEQSFSRWFYYINGMGRHNMKHFEPDLYLFANSEHSAEKNQIFKTFDSFQDWYYFYHGFAALDWFGNIPYRQPITQYSRVFISFNNLYTEKRSYRLSLIAGLLNRGLDSQGYISMSQHNIVDKIRGEIFDTNSQLSKNERKMIFQTLLPNPPKLIIDTDNHHGALSANDVLETMCKGLWHLVTETVYYDNKLHLTEKIFKPIVAQRPFILIAAPGNLAYLKSYGFQSFDRWIDESYDDIQDPAERIIAVLDQVEKLCRLSPQELHTMYQEMTEVLEHNFNWLYGGGFKELIVGELVDNFRRCLIRHNAGLNTDNINYINHSQMNWVDIKRRLTY
jgi:hypothetical protein